MIIPTMAIAGSLVAKKIGAAVGGHLPDHGGLFVGLLVGVILIVGGLTFFPALALGPIVEQLAMQRRHPVLSELARSHCDGNLTSAQAHAGIGAVRSEDRRAGDRLRLRQARSAHADEESGDVRARDRHRADDGHPDPRSRRPAAGISASSFRSSCGCGSPCCSPTSPKPSPKAAARRRPTRCAAAHRDAGQAASPARAIRRAIG